MSQVTRYPVEALEEFATRLLTRLDLPEEDAGITARALVQSDLEGVETHGLGRLPNYVARLRHGLVNPRPQMRLVRQAGATALLDADNGMGQVAAYRAMQEAIRLAETLGTGWVAVVHSNHFGAASFYVQQAVAAGMIGFALSNTPPGMAPHGGRQAALGTNPIGIGVPMGQRQPLIVDLATSAAARGHVIKAAREGKAIPPDWAMDAEGAPTTDPHAALKGALLPLGGGKGYALALAVEALCGVLTGAHMATQMPSFFDNWDTPSNVGHMLGAFNIRAFMDEPAEFAQRAEWLADEVRATPAAQGHAGVRLPGERRAHLAAERRAHGLPLSPATVQHLNALASELGVPVVGRR
ncbi:MAG: Ldh family oxidoreductase [Anaerolineae bacterium]|nr:Ldh family oxidoreductase [Anaerolineae bacterium]